MSEALHVLNNILVGGILEQDLVSSAYVYSHMRSSHDEARMIHQRDWGRGQGEIQGYGGEDF